MRILHVSPTYLPATRYGGTIHSVHGLCAALARRGHDVHVFTTSVDGADDSNVPHETPVDIDGVRVSYFRSPLARRIYWSPSMRRALRAEVPGLDLLHLHSVYLWPTAAAARAARGAAKPYIISPRGMLVRELIQKRSRIAKSTWIRWIESRNLAHAAAIHFTSSLERNEAEALKLELPQPFIVPNGVDLPAAGTAPRDDRSILFLGRINWKKRIDHLITALAGIPDAVLTVAGHDEDGAVSGLTARARALGVSGRVRFTGEVDRHRRDELLAAASVLVLPSISENFGNVVLEAMASGCPVVVTPGVGLAEIVEETGAGVVTEVERLADELRRLLDDKPLRRKMGANGRSAVERCFTWDAVAVRMEAAYLRIVDGSAAAGAGHHA
ncbi:MAG TPA: glycosyltransferase [Thermoanaerobaculia bacterium]|nr:glycosyltransferase [Thermoanaerobaculia bacterium]